MYGERGKGSLHATIIMGFSIFYTLIRVDAVRRLKAAAAAQDGALDSGPAEAVTAAKHNNNMMMGDARMEQHLGVEWSESRSR